MAVRRVGGGGKVPPLGQINVAAAVLAGAEHFAYGHAYQEELEQIIFRSREGEPDKEGLSNHRFLASLDRLPVLIFIWKESPHMTDAALKAAGIARMTVGGPLTTHGLSIIFKTGSRSAGAAIKQVAKIVRIGKIYGLIETRPIREKMIEIVGTAALHDMMLRLYIGQSGKLPPLPPEGDEL